LGSGADDVTRLEPLGALQQIELHGFALVQRAVTILLDGGEMNEDIFPCGPLDKTISFSPVKPLYCTLLSHNELLSPLLRLEIHILREARAYLIPSKPVDDLGFALQCDREPGSTRKAPEFRAVAKKNGTKLGSPSWWREFRLQYAKHQPKLTNVAADIPATAGIIFRNFLSGKRRINHKAKPIETAKHDPWFS
jgi:hypothetical protein